MSATPVARPPTLPPVPPSPTDAARVPLALVAHQVHVGEPLAFDVFRPDGGLLLARGQVLHDAAQLGLLLDRGTLVSITAFRAAAPDVAQAARAELPALWHACMSRVGEVLSRPELPGFRHALDACAEPVEALVARDPDLAIFQILRQEGHPRVQYGLTHAVHAAIVAHLIAVRLGWPEIDRRRAFRAALTMNLSMIELQGRLAEQAAPPTAEQSREIRAHPRRSRALLERAGITDTVWLDAVEQHHEERDGSGYPAGLRHPTELATLLHRADEYTAKLSTRAGRDAEAADRAGREVFMKDPEHPVCAALVKEFGVYPPGCFVALASGETGVVVKRGSTVMTPIVAALTGRDGAPLRAPVRRDTMMPLHAIVGVRQPREVRGRLAPEQLAALAG